MSAKRGGVYIAMNIITVFQINNTYVYPFDCKQPSIQCYYVCDSNAHYYV